MNSQKARLFAMSVLLYFIAEIVLGNLFSLALGKRYYTYYFLPLANGFTELPRQNAAGLSPKMNAVRPQR